MGNLKLKCETCGVEYEKYSQIKIWHDERPNVFFKWSLTYCDKCRRAKHVEALKQLPKVIENLSNNINPTE